jgi:glutamate transport system permease protein
MIALTKNTTVVATVGVAEAAYMMRQMLEFDISQLYWIFVIIAAGFVILTLPMGIFFTWLSRRLVVQR